MPDVLDMGTLPVAPLLPLLRALCRPLLEPVVTARPALVGLVGVALLAAATAWRVAPTLQRWHHGPDGDERRRDGERPDEAGRDRQAGNEETALGLGDVLWLGVVAAWSSSAGALLCVLVAAPAALLAVGVRAGVRAVARMAGTMPGTMPGTRPGAMGGATARGAGRVLRRCAQRLPGRRRPRSPEGVSPDAAHRPSPRSVAGGFRPGERALVACLVGLGVLGALTRTPVVTPAGAVAWRALALPAGVPLAALAVASVLTAWCDARTRTMPDAYVLLAVTPRWLALLALGRWGALAQSVGHAIGVVLVAAALAWVAGGMIGRYQTRRRTAATGPGADSGPPRRPDGAHAGAVAFGPYLALIGLLLAWLAAPHWP